MISNYLAACEEANQTNLSSSTKVWRQEGTKEDVKMRIWHYIKNIINKRQFLGFCSIHKYVHACVTMKVNKLINKGNNRETRQLIGEYNCLVSIDN